MQPEPIPGKLYLSVDFGPGSTDTGARPYGGTNPQWNCFSIVLSGGPNDTQTRVNVPTTVKVRVSNSDKANPVTDVHVDTYVMNPFIGIAQPNQAIQRLSGSLNSVGPGSGSTNPNDAHVINCKVQHPTQGPISWIPSQDELDATINGDGHMCVVANVYSDADGVVDGHKLLEAEGFQVVPDQHQAQRNCTVLPVISLKAETVQQFLVMPAPQEIETFVTLEPVDLRRGLGAGDRALVLSHDFVVVEGGDGCDTGELKVSFKGELFPLFASDRPLETKLTIDDREPPVDDRDDDHPDIRGGRWPRLPRHGHGHRGHRRHRLPGFGDAQKARLVVQTDEERPGAMQAFDVVQRDSKGRNLGGLRMITISNG